MRNPVLCINPIRNFNYVTSLNFLLLCMLLLIYEKYSIMQNIWILVNIYRLNVEDVFCKVRGPSFPVSKNRQNKIDLKDLDLTTPKRINILSIIILNFAY